MFVRLLKHFCAHQNCLNSKNVKTKNIKYWKSHLNCSDINDAETKQIKDRKQHKFNDDNFAEQNLCTLYNNKD